MLIKQNVSIRATMTNANDKNFSLYFKSGLITEPAINAGFVIDLIVFYPKIDDLPAVYR
jgi:hypothetical protein